MQTLALIAQEIALGSLAALLVFALPAIPPGFPSLIAHIAAAFWGIAGIVALRSGGGGASAALPFFALALLALVAARAALLGRLGLARGAIAVALLAGGAALAGDAVRLAARVSSGALPAPLVAASLVSSALLLGVVLVTMILGHWYLIPPPLPFTHLVRGAVAFLAACVVRTLVFLASIALLWRHADPALRLAFDRLLRVEGDVAFFALRVFWGIVGPLALGVLVVRTARLRANQSATGLLYVSLIFVLIGELLANFLLVESSLPL